MKRKYDFNVLDRTATALYNAGRIDDALKIYFFMADGDPSLDGGYLGMKIGECYEKRGEFYSAKYWYGRAVEENPAARSSCAVSVQRLEKLTTIDDLI
jgi:tetratricopeptide (TPR) repeat protein